MCTEEGDVGNSNECPPFTGPELYDRALLRDLRGSIKVSKADTSQIGCKANQNVPEKSHPHTKKGEKKGKKKRISNINSVRQSTILLNHHTLKSVCPSQSSHKPPTGLLSVLCMEAKNIENKENYKTVVYPWSKQAPAFWLLCT